MRCFQCSSCEEHGRIYDRGHKPAHILIKIMTPLGADVASTLGNSLIRAQQRLYAQAERNALRIAEASAANVEVSGPSEPWVDDLVSAWGGDSSALTVHESSNLSRPCGHDHAVPCSACFQVISGSRFLCANCPLTHNGFNLCASCEKRSLKLHDPAHFFIKLATPLPVSVDRGPYAGAASLLPPLYRDLEPPVGVQTSYSTDLVVERCISSAVRNWRNGGRRDDIEMRRLNDNGIREANLVPLDALIHPYVLEPSFFS